tara:strand:+ start:2928 stop:3098 length:171 start_codon:yes stop_codon:yes gene_type:complete
MKYYWDNDDSCVCKSDGKNWWVYDNEDKCFYEESPEAMLWVTLTDISEKDAFLKLV